MSAPDVMGEVVWCRLRRYAERRDGTRWGIGLSPTRLMWVSPDEVDAPGSYDMGTLVVNCRMTRVGAVQWGWAEAILPDWTDGTRALCADRCAAHGDPACWRLPELAARPVGAPAPDVQPCRDCLVGRQVGDAE
jgi:hypothetical protein